MNARRAGGRARPVRRGSEVAEDLAAGNLPHWNQPAWFVDRFVHGWVVLDGAAFPISATLLPLLAVLWPPVRRWSGWS